MFRVWDFGFGDLRLLPVQASICSQADVVRNCGFGMPIPLHITLNPIEAQQVRADFAGPFATALSLQQHEHHQTPQRQRLNPTPQDATSALGRPRLTWRLRSFGSEVIRTLNWVQSNHKQNYSTNSRDPLSRVGNRGNHMANTDFLGCWPAGSVATGRVCRYHVLPESPIPLN